MELLSKGNFKLNIKQKIAYDMADPSERKVGRGSRWLERNPMRMPDRKLQFKSHHRRRNQELAHCRSLEMTWPILPVGWK